MPPPDTTYIPGKTGLPPPVDSIVPGIDSADMSQYINSLNESVRNHAAAQAGGDRPQFLFSQGEMFLIVLGILGLFYFWFVYLPSRSNRKYSKEEELEAEQQLAINKEKYDGWFKKHNPYYCTLTPELQNLFLRRTIRFMNEKEFRFHEMQEGEYITALISGAAVQMTLGLKNFLMDYFPVIHVIRKEYVLTMDKETYYGHVSRNGIYISWNHFLDGYADYTDSINVGLHEMAHAVSFDVFLGQTDRHDLAFRSRLEDFADEGRPVFRAMREQSSHLLDDYGATNFDEFWAVCVETFFENPDEFSRTMPDLYLSIVDLLNQDPLNPSKIINRQLAGLEG